MFTLSLIQVSKCFISKNTSIHTHGGVPSPTSYSTLLLHRSLSTKQIITPTLYLNKLCLILSNDLALCLLNSTTHLLCLGWETRLWLGNRWSAAANSKLNSTHTQTDNLERAHSWIKHTNTPVQVSIHYPPTRSSRREQEHITAGVSWINVLWKLHIYVSTCPCFYCFFSLAVCLHSAFEYIFLCYRVE